MKPVFAADGRQDVHLLVEGHLNALRNVAKRTPANGEMY